MPVPIVEAVALHHNPSKNVQLAFCPLTAVHVVNVLDHEENDDVTDFVSPSFDMPYLERLGLQDKVSLWKEIYTDYQTAAASC